MFGPVASAPEEGRARAGDDGWDDDALEHLARAELAELAGVSPQDRFEREFGIPATPDTMGRAGFASGGSAEEIAVAAQNELVQLEHVLRIAEAHRIGALLQAFEASLADLAERFGAAYGTRGSRGATTFFASVALRTGQNPLHLAHLVDTAALARDRLPMTWAVFQSGAVTWRALDTAVKQAEGLGVQHWAAYDEVAAIEVVASRRLKDVLRRTRERLQDGTADARAKSAFERRTIHLDHGSDGSSTWSMTGPAEDQTAWDAALTKAAIASKVAGDARTITQLRYDIARDLIVEGLQRSADPAAVGLMVPERKGVDVKLILTVPVLAWLGHSMEQAHLAGHGPIAMATAKRLAGEATSMLRVLTDPVTGARLAMDRAVYSPPADLRRWIVLRDGWCRFPGCRRPAENCDVDHLHEWQDGGRTDADNLLSECRSHHAAKSLGLWQAELDGGGWPQWGDPWGNRFADPPVDSSDPAPAGLLPPGAEGQADDPPPF